MPYGYFKHLPRRTATDKVFRDKGFGIAKNLKYDGYKCGIASLVYKFFDEKSSGGGVKSWNISNQELVKELHKLTIKKFEKQKVYPSIKDNICAADLADVQLLSKFNERNWFLLLVIDVYSKYNSVVSLKGIKGITIINAFQRLLDKLSRKPKKVWEDKGSKFYNRSIKSWQQDNDVEMYSVYNEGKSVVAERFIRTSKNKIYKHMSSVPNNVYTVKLDDIYDKYKSIYHSVIKMKPFDAKSCTYIDFGTKKW